jgi:hypothetical protein
MIDYQTRINQIIYHFEEKKNKKLQTELFLRLCSKVREEDEDDEIIAMINETYSLLSELDNNEEIKPKSYQKSLGLLKKTVKQKFSFTPKGALQEEYTGIGIAIGVALGSAFVSINPVLISIGLPIGLAIGAALGKKMESTAERTGKTY